MGKRYMIFVILVFFGFAFGSAFAEEAQPMEKPARASEEMLRITTHDEQTRRLDELERSLVNLERRLDRLDDRFDMLDRDLKDLKRKV